MRISDWSSDVCSSDLERILREKMLDVGEQQFLMLLLVMDAEGDERQRGRRQAGQGALHRGIDMRAPDADFVERRARQQAALRARMARDRKSTRLNSSH